MIEQRALFKRGLVMMILPLTRPSLETEAQPCMGHPAMQSMPKSDGIVSQVRVGTPNWALLYT